MGKLEKQYENLKGKDYYYDLVFTLEKFKGIDTFMPITGDWNIVKKSEKTDFISQNVNFSYKRIKSGYRFHFSDNVTSLTALNIMTEICRNVMINNRQKYALYFVEIESKNAHLIY